MSAAHTHLDLIFSTHAWERLGQRQITSQMVWAAVHQADRQLAGKQPHTTKFEKTLHGRRLQVVATRLADQNKWLVVSVWVRGEDDKAPLAWRLITLPFRVVWWVLKFSVQSISKRKL